MEPRGEALLSKLREQCLSIKGCGGIKQLSSFFRKMDADFSKKICFKEFADGVKRYGLYMGESDLQLLFKLFDRDGNGSIDFHEFVNQLRTPMTEPRVSVINEAFDKLDVNQDGVLKLDDLRVVYAANARRHPKYLSGEWTEDETLQNFLDSIDTPGSPDGKVTRDEWINYYSGVSATIEDDCYFDLLMRACYNLPPKGSGKF
ncbi:calcyphosin-like protein isoform X2 [Haliotis cracherodii]|uniref:calcyphosin-like protein isoform X2 n=1 Tax=Haliotis rufescens TaxID=6454 RepID=UPI001EB073C3|nr:calcyphosin-like protein isoform X2 [Haliotis rufescens]